MNQFSKLIIEESLIISKQLSASGEGEPSALAGVALSKDELEFVAVNSRNKMTVARRLMLLITIVVTIYLFLNCDFQTIILQSYANGFTLGDAFQEIVLTLGFGLIPTLLGGILALFLGLLASRNLAPKQVVNIIKGLVMVVRTVPTIIWVIMIAAVAGFGSAAVVVGMTLHSLSYLTKAFSESFECLDRSVIEALMATGANWWQIVFRAVIPSYVSNLCNWTCLRLEINFANAIALVTAGTSGLVSFDLREVGLITYFILAFAIVLESGSMRFGRRFSY
ncbi:ABC transporter permease subunit [Desulfosporosinus sp. OT]|uniref:PhnE/PtxC family ABC transporter permease n=1 Tax=Desulfosporosinus sp. OT TaxID=913865 RepID=UPI0002239E32|nr:ABC transporter permease subunit [Desulfosporosinus sp. OT]EGW40083.1 binding--dependent transport system inner membrane component family protein [Desulfosporosinus sp. OT]